jgi:PKHD-type hydroxylase
MIKYREPRWKSYIVKTKEPVFTADQCDDIIRMGQSYTPEEAKIGVSEKDAELNKSKRTTTISWIPFDDPRALPMYSIIEDCMNNINTNHFGFEFPQLSEPAQFTVYPEGAFYDWHTDSDIHFIQQPLVRKISMTILLSDPKEFEGGELQFVEDERDALPLVRGEAAFFASFVRHRVKPVTKGNRKSLVMWFGGPPLK